MERLLLLFLPLLLLSCNKPEPNPEIRDPIYQEFKTQQDLAKKAIAEAEKTLIEKKADLEKVKPQTGQIKYAQKRLWDTQRTLDSLIQQEKYWSLRIKEREQTAKTEYIKSFKAGRPWPDPKEFQEYSTEKRLREARLQWDAKERIEKFKIDNPTGAPGSKGASQPKSTTPEGGE